MNKTPIELAIAEIYSAIVRTQQEEMRYRFNGAYHEAEDEKEKRIELERVKKDIEALLPVEKELFDKAVEYGHNYGIVYKKSSKGEAVDSFNKMRK